MPPRIRLRAALTLVQPSSHSAPYICLQCRHASFATATTPAPPINPSLTAIPPIARYAPTQPPSHKPPEFRKSQLHRQYQSLLRASPLVVIFQHNNLKATEWTAVRRELANALRKVDEAIAKDRANAENYNIDIGSETKIVAVQTGIFASALRVVEFWNPDFESTSSPSPITTTSESSSTSRPTHTDGTTADPSFTHGLSRQAWKTSTRKARRRKHGLEPILSGPLALLCFPSVSPRHLKAAISILAPSKEIPAPKRRENPGYHEPAVQMGAQKLMLLAARVEGKVFDMDGTRWVGGIEGGIDGLRGQLVAMLQSVGAGVTRTLEAAGRSLYVTVEGRRGMLEEEEKGKAGS